MAIERADRTAALPSRLYVICDVDALEAASWEPVAFVDACLEAGASLFQLRAKRLDAGAFAALTRRVLARAGTSATVIVNDRVDVALVTGAGGAHVGQEDLAPAAARAQLGDAAIVGVSTHTEAQLAEAARQPVSYVAVGPVFGTATKDTGYAPVGVELIARAREIAGAGMPLVAIGGITPDRAADAVRAGADAVAVIGGLIGPQPGALVARYLDRLA
ncbi:MAG: thiamine phosphate synthase [Vicinamibacterales bacterium]